MTDIWEQVGQYSNYFHGIKVVGYIFDVFNDNPPSDTIWCKSYFDKFGGPALPKLVSTNYMTNRELDFALQALEPLKQLKFEPTLAHGNLTSKNIVVDGSGKAHIIDWGSCQGHLATALDIAELMVFKTPHAHIQAYLRGHQLPSDYLEQNVELLDRLQLARFFITANWLCEIDSPRKGDLANYLSGTRTIMKRLIATGT